MAARFVAVLSILFIALYIGYSESTAQSLVTCPQIVQRAVESVGANCGSLDRNSACYGYQNVSAEFSEPQPVGFFSTPSDRARLFDIERLGTTPMDEALNQWGIALMSVQANLPNALPGQNVVFMLLGDSQIEDAVETDAAATSAASLDVTAASDTPLLHDPDAASAVVGNITAGTALTADARSADGTWVRVISGDLAGWVPVSALAGGVDTASLSETGSNAGTPMQAFYFQSGITGTTCADAPNALVIQGPKDLTVSLNANGAEMTLGSTIVLYQVPVSDAVRAQLIQQYGDLGPFTRLLQIVVLDGHVVLNPGEPNEVHLYTGQTTYRCLSENQSLGINGQSDDREVISACPWAPPRPVTEGELEQFQPIDNLSLNYPITLPLGQPDPETPVPTFETTLEIGSVSATPEFTPTPLPTAGPTEPPGLPPSTEEIIVGPSVNPPVAHDDAQTINEDTPGVVNVIANDIDLDGDPLSVTAVTQGAHGVAVNNGDGTVTYTPDLNYNGSDSFTYTVGDGTGDTDTATVVMSILPVNDPPDAVDDSASTEQGFSVNIDVLANDSDPEGDEFYIDDLGDPSNGVVYFDEGGGLTYYPNPGFSGVDTFTYTLSDGEGFDTATVTVTVDANPGPVAVDDTAIGAEDVATGVSVLDNDYDPDEEDLWVASSTDGANGTTTTDGTRVFYTPNSGFTGLDSFTYTIEDPSGNAATATVTITIGTNIGPTANDDGSPTLPITTTLNTPLTVNVLNNDVDPDGGALTVVSVTTPANGSATTNGTTVVYTPNTSYVGPDTIRYTIQDPNGASSSADVYVTVSGNSPPTAVTDNATTNEDTQVTIPVLDNDTDPDTGDTLTIYSFDQGYAGSVTSTGTALVYTPLSDYYGWDYFSYTMTDGNGSYSTAYVNVTINSMPDPAVAVDDSYAAQENGSLTVDPPGVLENDTDPDSNSWELTAVLVSDVTNGALDLNSDGSFVYSPDTGFTGTDSFTYHVFDGSVLSNVATVTLSVAVNAAPSANPDAYQTPIDTTLNFPANGPLANDTDANADPLTAVLVTDVSNGTLTLNPDGSFTYTPNTGFSGTDSFTYQASDGAATSNVATATIAVGAPAITPHYVSVAGPSYPTPTPLAPFSDYSYIDSMIRSSVPDALRNTVFARLIVRGGVLQRGLNWGYIGDQALIDQGIVFALDVFSTVGQTDFSPGIGICMQGRGRLFFLNANFTPRSAIELDWTYVDGYTCATILAPGMVVMVKDTGAASSASVVTPTASASACEVTTLYQMHLRAGTSTDSESLALLPAGVTLAGQNVGGWYAVTYNGMAGYLSGQYVAVTQGCIS